jgi:hypothetical protein
MLAETFFDLASDPSHWCFEILTDLVLGGLGALVARPLIARWVAKHDRDHHGG